jgi:glycosyltransferase involved in cell wall biosynthesis
MASEAHKWSVTFCAYDREGAVGGPIAWAADFAAFLNESTQLQVLILCPGGRPKSSLASRLEFLGISCVVFDSGSARTLDDEVEWVLDAWRRQPSQIFIANLVLPAMYAARWIRQAGAQTIGVVHSDPRHDPYYRDMIAMFVTGETAWQFDTVVAVSRFITEQIRSAGVSAERVVTIPCGTKTFKGVSVSYNSQPLRIIYSGRLSQVQKRIRDVVEAFLSVAVDGVIEATICGDGEERAWVESRLQSQGAVRFAGRIPPGEMEAVLRKHHVGVLLSDSEGVPIALLEAMALGLVPIALDEPSGAREIIQNKQNGLVVTDRGQSFGDAVNSLLNNEYWARLSAEARSTVESRYAHDVVFPQWIELFRSKAPMVLHPDSIPRRVNLRSARAVDRFNGYPMARPSRLTTALKRASALSLLLRQSFRPRARLRSLIRSKRD